MCGYVVQDDILLGHMTVRENIQFSARLRLPADLYSDDAKEKMVDSVLLELGLTKVKDSIIGNEMVRGVSGGERKRTNIACELCIRPGVLFLDEPTTGLDAATAVQVIKTIRHLAELGCTVIMSIHQPRFSIFKLLDKVILLSEGHIIYQGKPEGVVASFERVGYICEKHNNPADFMFDVLSGVCERTVEFAAVETSETAHDILLKAYLASDEAKATDSSIDVAIKAGLKKPDLQASVKYGVGPWRQFVVICGRYVLGMKRLPVIIMAQLFTMVIFAGMVGGIYWQLGLDFKGLQNRVGAIFFMIMSMIFANLSALEILINERALFLHQKAAGYFHTAPYFMATILCDLIPMRIIPMSIFGALAYPALGFQAEWGHFFWFELVLMTTAIASGALCYFVSSVVGIFAIANLVVSVCYVVMMLFGGLLVNLETLPSFLHWLQYLSLFKQGYSALAITELHGLKFELAPFVSITGDKYLEEQGFALSDRPRNVSLMAASALVYLLLSYVALVRLRKE